MMIVLLHRRISRLLRLCAAAERALQGHHHRLDPGDEIAATTRVSPESQGVLLGNRCPICATAMDAYLLDETRKLHICGNNPDCAGYEIEQGQYRSDCEGPSTGATSAAAICS